MEKFIISIFVLLLSFNFVFADTNETIFQITEKTGTGLDHILDIIYNDSGLQANVPEDEILEAMYYGNEMNKIIIDSIIRTNIAVDENLSTDDIKLLNSYINSNFYNLWVIYHGDDENGEETGYHLVQNDGGTTQIFSKNAVNTVIDGIYHLGFPFANVNQVQNEDGNANAKYSDIAYWLSEFLAEDLNRTSLVGNLETESVVLSSASQFNTDLVKFDIIINNETFDNRTVNIIPSIICNDVRNTLGDNNGVLDSRILSAQSKTKSCHFEFSVNDLLLNVPWNTDCQLQIKLYDNYKTNLILNNSIKFALEDDSHELGPSVSGSSMELLNFMSINLLNGINSGYNSLKFTLQNYDDVDKEFTVTFIAQGLNLGETTNINLGANSKRTVNIPIYVGKDVKPGLYPVRLGVSSDDDKRVKYSYIKIN